MRTREAFDAIENAIALNPRMQIVRRHYDAENFGNFHIAFREEGKPRSIVNDRFELVHCDDLDGHNCKTVLPSFQYVDETTILQKLGL